MGFVLVFIAGSLVFAAALVAASVALAAAAVLAPFWVASLVLRYVERHRAAGTAPGL